MENGHLNDKGEHIVNEGIQCLVDHGVHGDVSNTLQLVVDKQLGRHRDEAEQVHEVGERGDDPVIPGLVRIVNQRIDGIAGHQRIQNGHQMAHGGVIVLLRLAGAVRGAVVDAQDRLVTLPVEADLHRLGNLPQLHGE